MQCWKSERRLVGCRRSAVGDTERQRQEQVRGTDICRAIHLLVPRNLDAESLQSHGRTGAPKVNPVYVLRCIPLEQGSNARRYEEVAKRAKKKQKNRDAALL